MHELGAEGSTDGRISLGTDTLIVPSFDNMTSTGLAATRGLMLKINKARITTFRMLERVLLQNMFCFMKRGRVMSICVYYYGKIMDFYRTKLSQDKIVTFDETSYSSSFSGGKNTI